MSSDYYSILGVSPTAEDVVIRAAYRALMRHYHPDTNPDPEAQRKAQQITAAFAVLRDPARRAEYDVGRAGPVLWAEEELPIAPHRPPAMRGWALASAVLALALVVAVWTRPQPSPPRARITPAARQAPAAKPRPIVELEPETERLARLRGDSAVLPPAPEVVAPIDKAVAPPANPLPLPRSEPVRLAASIPPRSSRPIARPLAIAPPSTAATAPKASPASEASAGCRPGASVVVSAGCKNARVATLDRMAAGFFSQSMAHADAAKKEQLLSSHTRSAATRGACRSDSCLTDAYLRQMREISAIMEGRPVPRQ